MIRIGVIENNIDPLKIGRCQVRIFGIHTEDLAVYPMEDLPWASFLMNSSCVSGQGNIFIPNNGDYVALSFLDPEQQIPIILGVIPKFIDALPNFTQGFSDPNSENPSSSSIGESGISSFARNDSTPSEIQDKKNNKKTGVMCDTESWDEPETPYDPIYPNNKVIHTKHHVIELDDTDGKERVHIYHKSGTSKEIHPNGDEVNIIKAKRYLIIDSDNNVLVSGNYNFRIAGDQNKEIVGSDKQKIGGNQDKEVVGNDEEIITGTKKITATGEITITAPKINLN